MLDINPLSDLINFEMEMKPFIVSQFGPKILACNNVFLSLCLLTKMCLQKARNLVRLCPSVGVNCKDKKSFCSPAVRAVRGGQGRGPQWCSRRATPGIHLPLTCSYASTSPSFSTLSLLYFCLWFFFFFFFFFFPLSSLLFPFVFFFFFFFYFCFFFLLPLLCVFLLLPHSVRCICHF